MKGTSSEARRKKYELDWRCLGMIRSGSFFNPVNKAKIIDLGKSKRWYDRSTSCVDPASCESVTGFRFFYRGEEFVASWSYQEYPTSRCNKIYWAQGDPSHLSEFNDLLETLAHARWLEEEILDEITSILKKGNIPC